MLDRARLLHELQGIADSLFIDDQAAAHEVYRIWRLIAADPTFAAKARAAQAPWPVPSWHDALDRIIPVQTSPGPHRMLAVDGSQIYPDRHQGLSCYLINIGGVSIAYGASANPVHFFSTPFVFSGNSEELVQHSAEFINGKRQEIELKEGVRLALKTCAENPQELSLLLFDGSLIFWHLEAKDVVLKETFLSTYLACLLQLQKAHMLTASYISMPRSRELINLVRLYLCDFDPQQSERCASVDRLVDTSIAWHFLAPGERTIVFKNHSSISENYPESVRPHFFYMHVGSEIGRVEIPAWIAHDEHMVNQVAAMVYDQCMKGRGYPVVLAEAHEQAVVKGPDRDFFYHVITKIGLERQRVLSPSQKSVKKRGLGI